MENKDRLTRTFDTAKLNLLSPLGDDMVKVFVGPAEKVFHIHKDMLVMHSDFFRGALNGDWVESRSGEVKLPEQNAVVFSLWNHWLYHKKLPIPIGGFIMEDFPEEDEEFLVENIPAKEPVNIDIPPLLLEAWLLGDKFQAVSFKNAVMHIIYQNRHNKWISWNSVELCNLVYSDTPTGSKLRRMVSDLWLADMSRKQLSIEKDLDGMKPNIARDILVRLYNMHTGLGNTTEASPSPFLRIKDYLEK